ncbi:MAG: tetratricopeptide repeat protein [Deltaproteobacteria bacterium]|nr:tetratricopeptide repeat protein [Deltaproteobacteria bacterium]
MSLAGHSYAEKRDNRRMALLAGKTGGTVWLISAAAVIVAATLAAVHRWSLLVREAPATSPATVAVAQPASRQLEARPPSLPQGEADGADAVAPCSPTGEGPAAFARRREAPAADPEALATLSLAHEQETRGDFKEAEQAYRSLLEASWSNAQAHAGLGRLLSRRGELQEAEEHLQRAALLQPGDARTRLDLAAVQVWLLRYSSARQQIQAVVEAEPEGAHADGARTLLQLVDALDAPAEP